MTSIKDETPSAVASTITGSFDPPMDSGEANGLFIGLLSDITKECGLAGATMIGHVKANVRSGDEMLSVSSTTEDGNVRSRSLFASSVKDYDMTLNVIVYGIDVATISEIVTRRARSLGDHEMEIVSESGCQDPECGDPDCTDSRHRIIRIG